MKRRNRQLIGTIIASITALQFASLAVVAESYLSESIAVSGIRTFASLMQLIYIPIGIIEGLISSIVILFATKKNIREVTLTFSGISFILGGFIAKYISEKPDGLEWSLLNIPDSIIMQTQSSIYKFIEVIQAKLAIFSDETSTLMNIAGTLIVAITVYTGSILLSKKSAEIDVK